MIQQTTTTQRITLQAHDFQAMDVSVQGHAACYEWELVLKLSADGEPVEVPIRRAGKPFRTTGLASSYRAGLKEEGTSEELSSGQGRLVAANPTELTRYGHE